MIAWLGPFLPLVGGVLAFLLSLYLAPILIRAALRYGIVDHPKPPLKEHREPTPYLGGLVVFAAFLGALALTFPFDARVLAILLAASLVVSVGLIDDLGTLTPKDKLLGQLIAAIVLVKAGVVVEIAAVPSPVDELVSVLWLVTCMNAFNIVDVSDGLSTTAGAVGATGALTVAILNREPVVAAMSACLLGACLGFLRVNWQPARMYLGDTGSMFLGAVLGALAMVGRYSESNVVSSWFVPLVLCGIPLFDLTLVVIARTLAGRKVWLGSPDHFAVRLRLHGVSAGATARGGGLLGLLAVGAAVLSTVLDDRGAMMVLAGVAALAIGLLLLLLVRFPPSAPAAAADSGPPPPGAGTAA